MAINLVPFLASNTQNIATCMRDQKVPSPGRTWQWRIQGRPPPLFLDETEARRVENIFFQTTTPPPPYLKVWIRYCLESPVSVTERKNHYHAACLSLSGKRTYTMLARVQQSYETRSYDFKIKYWDDFDTRLEWLKNSDLQNIAMSHNKTDQRICRLSFKLKSWLVVADFLKKHKHIVG